MEMGYNRLCTGCGKLWDDVVREKCGNCGRKKSLRVLARFDINELEELAAVCDDIAVFERLIKEINDGKLSYSEAMEKAPGYNTMYDNGKLGTEKRPY